MEDKLIKKDNVKTLDKFFVNGKNALITGACGLLGVEHARALLEIGAHVILTDLSLEALDECKKSLIHDNFDQKKISIFVMDVTKIDQIKKVNELLKKENIFVNILINNAAIDPKVKKEVDLLENTRLENFSLNQWNLQLNVGLTGAFLCSQVFGSEMARAGSGVILNIASDLSVISPDQRLYRKEGLKDHEQPVKPVTYSVIKTGLIGLTRYLATYWADKGVRANALSPGGVFNGQGEEFVKRLSTLIPMGRMALKDEYKSTIQYLCSDASAYMNGQNIIMDGGRSVL